MVGWGLTQISLTEGEHELLRNRILQTIPGQNLDEEEPPDSMPTLGFLLMTSRHPYYPLDLRPSHHSDSLYSQIYCHGELLHQVQMAQLYQDDKQFVDMSLATSPGKATLVCSEGEAWASLGWVSSHPPTLNVAQTKSYRSSVSWPWSTTIASPRNSFRNLSRVTSSPWGRSCSPGPQRTGRTGIDQERRQERAPHLG